MEECLRINEDCLSQLRLVNDILMCANTPHELQQMLQELVDKIDNQGSDNIQIEAKMEIKRHSGSERWSYVSLGRRYSTRSRPTPRQGASKKNRARRLDNIRHAPRYF